MQTQPVTTLYEHRCAGSCLPDQNPWIVFNRKLERDADGLLDEASLEGRLAALMPMEIDNPYLFWLTYARIAELTLKLAGDYADSCEFQAAGDLLVNPRRIDVYRRGWPIPVVKDRHRGLSQQFAAVIGDAHPAAWLARETCIHVRQEALLPCLKQALATCSFMTPDYLAGLDRRMGRIADTIAFLSSWQIADSVQLYQRLQAAGPEGAALVRSKLCRFDRQRFNAMGVTIHRVVRNWNRIGVQQLF